MRRETRLQRQEMTGMRQETGLQRRETGLLPQNPRLERGPKRLSSSRVRPHRHTFLLRAESKSDPFPEPPHRMPGAFHRDGRASRMGVQPTFNVRLSKTSSLSKVYFAGDADFVDRAYRVRQRGMQVVPDDLQTINP